MNLEEEGEVGLDELEIRAPRQRHCDEIEKEREFVAFAHDFHAELAQGGIGARCGLAAQKGEHDVDWAMGGEMGGGRRGVYE